MEVVEAARESRREFRREGETKSPGLARLRLQSLAAARQLRELAVRPLGYRVGRAAVTVFGRRHTLHRTLGGGGGGVHHLVGCI